MVPLNEKDYHLLLGDIVILNEDETEDETTVAPVQETEVQQTVLERVVLTTQDLRSQLLSEGSNFLKIISSLGLDHIHQEIKTENDLNPSAKINVLWSIGLDKETTKKLEGRADKVLLTGNPELEMTREEKLGLYNPIKEFASYLK